MHIIKSIGLLLSLALMLTSAALAQGMPPTLVVTEQVSNMQFHDQITLVGRTEATVNSRLVSEVTGKVKAIDAQEGVWVQEGAPLVTVDSEPVELSYEAMDAQTNRARATADLAKKDLDRAKDLFDRSLIPQSRFDSVTVSARIAEETYNQLRAERDLLALDVKKCTIRAPFSGYTVKKLVDVGEGVAPGTPVYEMVDLSKVKVTVDLPERHFGHVEIGSPVAIKVAADGVGTVKGKVTGIAPSAGEATHTFPVIVTVNNSEGKLGGGMLVKATLTMSHEFTSLAVSKDAIVRQGTQTMVYTVADGKAVPIPVMTSSTDGKMVAVTGDGLAAGMPVVVRGNERIFPGSPVRLGDGGGAGTPDASKDASANKQS